MIYLVRHAEVELRAGVPPEEWELTEAGLAAAAQLELPPVAVVASSPEPKALATAAALGRSFQVEPDLREVRRPPGPILPREEWLALVGGYLAGAEVPGWEPATDARARFGACLERLAAGGDVAAVTHGTVIALWLGLSADEWAELPLPAVVEVPA